jgi:hypothetical protein
MLSSVQWGIQLLTSHVHARTHAPVQRKCSICPTFPNQFIYIHIYLYINNIYIYLFSHHASYGVHPMHLQDPWHWLDASRPELDWIRVD